MKKKTFFPSKFTKIYLFPFFDKEKSLVNLPCVVIFICCVLSSSIKINVVLKQQKNVKKKCYVIQIR